MAETLFVLRGHLDDVTVVQIGLPCVELAECKRDAERYVEVYGRVQVINTTTGAVVFKATRRR